MMEKEIVKDYGHWHLPDSWDEVTLKMFQDIERYYDNTDKKFDVRDVLHIFTNRTIDEINNLPLEFTEKLINRLQFIEELPKEQEPSNKITIDGEEYAINYMEKLKTGEYISVDSIIKNDKYNYATILAVLCRKEGEIFDSKFEAEVLEDRIKMFEGISVTKLLPLLNFFLSLYMVSEIPSQLYSKVEEELNHIQKHIETSDKIGVFKKRYLNWRVKKLQRYLKLNKNT